MDREAPVVVVAARKAVLGMEFVRRTGRRQRETHVACAKKATRNLGGEERIESKRESVWFGVEEMRW
jgi:hypothetical protein